MVQSIYNKGDMLDNFSYFGIHVGVSAIFWGGYSGLVDTMNDNMSIIGESKGAMKIAVMNGLVAYV